MFITELWRYPVKSLGGEALQWIELTLDGIVGDRILHVRGRSGLLTARVSPQLLTLHTTVDPEGHPMVQGRHWNDPVTIDLIRATAGQDAALVRYDGPERFDVMPLLVATDGSIAVFGHDVRRLRPNIVIGGVDGLAEREWPGHSLRLGDDVLVGVDTLRLRCNVPAIDPVTGSRNASVSRVIRRVFDGRLGLNCWVIRAGQVSVGDRVELIPGAPEPPIHGGWLTGAPYRL